MTGHEWLAFVLGTFSHGFTVKSETALFDLIVAVAAKNGDIEQVAQLVGDQARATKATAFAVVWDHMDRHLQGLIFFGRDPQQLMRFRRTRGQLEARMAAGEMSTNDSFVTLGLISFWVACYEEADRFAREAPVTWVQ